MGAPQAKVRSALIVDDNPAIRQILRVRLERRGWSVTEAADAYNGLRKFRACKPQLVTLDLIMPINNGLGAVELAQTINDEAPDTVLVVVSGHAAKREVGNFFRRRRIPILSKASVEHPRMEQLLSYLDSVFASPSNAVDSGRLGE